MKKIKNTIASLTAVALLTGLALNFNACSEQSPMSTNTQFQPAKNEIQILRHRDASEVKLAKVVSVSKMVSVQNGGQLNIEHKGKNKVRIDVALTVPPGSITENAVLSMALDDELLMVSFDIPAGVTFSQLPNLTITAQGLDLGDIDAADLNVYHKSNDQWLPVQNGSVSESSGGSIIAMGGFGGATTNSRYAIAAE